MNLKNFIHQTIKACRNDMPFGLMFFCFRNNLPISDLEVAYSIVQLVCKILKIHSGLRDKSECRIEFFH